MPVILLPEGRREIDNLRKIAEALLKNEIAAGWLRGRCGHMPIAVPESEDPGLADIAKTMLEFDDVDRNIVRELGGPFHRDGTGGGQWQVEAVGLERKEGEAEPRSCEPPDSASA